MTRVRSIAIAVVALAGSTLTVAAHVPTAKAGQQCGRGAFTQTCAARRAATLRAIEDARHRWDVGFWGDAFANYNAPQMAYTTSGTAVYCKEAHPSYDPSSGRYVGLDGFLRRCP